MPSEVLYTALRVEDGEKGTFLFQQKEESKFLFDQTEEIRFAPSLSMENSVAKSDVDDVNRFVFITIAYSTLVIKLVYLHWGHFISSCLVYI